MVTAYACPKDSIASCRHAHMSRYIQYARPREAESDLFACPRVPRRLFIPKAHVGFADQNAEGLDIPPAYDLLQRRPRPQKV
eukprot:14284718-Alexandrium_andersonii.AAC.1